VTRPLLGASVSGSSAWIIAMLLRDVLPRRVRQLECDPAVSGDVVRHLRGTAAAIEEAARLYRERVAEVTASVEVESAGGDAGLGNLPIGWGVAEVAASLGCSERWVTQLIAMGRLAATKRGREWRIDVNSVEDYRRRGVSSAA
jgi:excisionase family DNA binding protein